MAEYVESRGPSLKMGARERERERELHHLRIRAHSEATAESPKWVVEHHSSENDREPKEHEFEDGHAMLAHIAEHTGVSEAQADNHGRGR